MHRKKKRQSHTGCFVVLGLLVIAVVAALVVLTTVMKEVKGNPKEDGAAVTVTVEQGSGSATIANRLQEAGIIKYPQLFRQYLKQTGRGGELQYGDFQLNPGMGYDEIIEVLCTYVKAETVTVTFPEGSCAVAIAQKMEEAGLCSVEAFLNEANNGDFSEFEFWSYIQTKEGNLMKCEGYLFPNTYEFLPGDNIHNLVATFYREFDRQITEEMYARMESSGMTLEDVVILASFIQEEAGMPEEDARVSAVFHNRLESNDPLWAQHQLQSNASSYIMWEGDNNYLWNSPMAEYMGWVEAGKIPEDVLAYYDTYRVSGLPAGPISNPGAAAIQAALYPDEEYIRAGYFFFVTGHPNGNYPGQYFYSKTAYEHEQNVAKAGWK